MKILAAFCLTLSVAWAQFPPLDSPPTTTAALFRGTSNSNKGFLYDSTLTDSSWAAPLIPNWIANPGGEAGDTSGWNRWNRATIGYSTARKRTGNGSLFYVAETTQAVSYPGIISDATTDTAGAGARTLTVTWNLYVFNPTTNTNNSVNISLRDNATGYQYTGSSTSPAKGAWQQIRDTYVVSGGPARTGFTLAISFVNAAAGDTTYIDDVDFAVVYEYVVLMAVKPATGTIAPTLFALARDSVNGNNFISNYLETSGKVAGDNSGARGQTFGWSGVSAMNTASYGKWNLLAARVNTFQTEQGAFYINGTKTTLSVNIRTSYGLFPFRRFLIGQTLGTISGNWFAGDWAHFQFIRFNSGMNLTNVEALIQGVAATYLSGGLPSIAQWEAVGGTVMAHYDFRKSTWLTDLSGKGHDLSVYGPVKQGKSRK